MKKFLILFACLLSFSCVYCQTSDFEINKIDDVTGVKILKTKSRDITSSVFNQQYFSISFTSIDQKLMLSINFTMRAGKVNSLDIPKNGKLVIKLNHNKQILLFTPKAYKTEILPNRTMSLIKVSPNYLLTKQDMLAIRDVGIINMQISTLKGEYHTNLKEKDNNNISSMINCILANM